MHQVNPSHRFAQQRRTPIGSIYCEIGWGLQPQPGVSIPVVMMVYSVREVTAAARADAVPMTCPTVLDSKPWPYYFPAPVAIPYGRAMALRTDGGEESLQPELLHTKIKYKRSHIKAMALIERPWGRRSLGTCATTTF